MLKRRITGTLCDECDYNLSRPRVRFKSSRIALSNNMGTGGVLNLPIEYRIQYRGVTSQGTCTRQRMPRQGSWPSCWRRSPSTNTNDMHGQPATTRWTPHSASNVDGTRGNHTSTSEYLEFQQQVFSAIDGSINPQTTGVSARHLSFPPLFLPCFFSFWATWYLITTLFISGQAWWFGLDSIPTSKCITQS